MTNIISRGDLDDIQIVGDAFLDNAKCIVVTQSTHAEAIDFTANISTALKELEKKRKELVKPLNDRVKGINKFFRELQVPFDQANEIMRQKLTEYRKEEEKRRKELEKELESEMGIPIAVPKQHTTQRGQEGQAIVKKHWTYGVDDLSKVPREYLTLDEKKVKDAIKQGIRNIKGLRIYEEERLTIRGG